MVHEIAGPAIPQTIPGLKAVNAVDAAGVHPLLLALGSERYVPYAKREPQELLTIAHAVLGFGQLSLAKYLLIAAQEDAPQLDIQDIPAFFHHLLERIDWRRDLHFQTRTTMDTLDYSARGLNKGSKVVMAAAGAPVRTLATKLPTGKTLPKGFTAMHLILPGMAVVSGPAFSNYEQAAKEMGTLEDFLKEIDTSGLPLIVVTDDADYTARTLRNALWVTFTRSDPATDIYGVDAFILHKHWGCSGPLLIDARVKLHHAPPLEADPQTTASVDALAVPGKSLHGII
jgi:4-hydroxy-3-polyprenylbenzoate decarboxylase